jgi:hypothetical protein
VLLLLTLNSNLKAARALGMETIRESRVPSTWHLCMRPRLHYLWQLRHHAAPRTILTSLLSDVPIGGTLNAVKQLEGKLGIDLTSDLDHDNITSAKL